MRHAVKIIFLISGLGFLFWWGWSGNFVYNPESPFRFSTSDNYYVFSFGGKGMGYSRRVVEADKPDAGMRVKEDSLVNLKIPGFDGDLRLRSNVLYGPDGRPLEAEFSVPGLAFAKAEAKVDRGFLYFNVNLGPLSRRIEKAVPKEGPLLVSAVAPWLSRQREVVLGKVLVLRLFDPVKMDFVRAELLIDDVSEPSDEIRVFEITLTLPGGVSKERLDANGILLRQRMGNLDAGLDLIQPEDPARETAAETLAAEPGDLTGSATERLAAFLPDFMSNLPLNSIADGKSR
ncbi:MAG: hypothetical protein LBF41_08615 [Deltaproteobacteria bacterium]|nr:hypothetical protein [Deltaproteobacteria bacterium]